MIFGLHNIWPAFCQRPIAIKERHHMDRLFFIIGRINSLLLLLVLLGAALWIVWMNWGGNQWQQRGAIDAVNNSNDAKRPVRLEFEQPERIASADAQMIQLSTQGESAKFSSGGAGRQVRNVLFFTDSEKTARWLFKTHRNLIRTNVQLHEAPVDTKEQPARALYFEYITRDSNGDGKLSDEDHSSVGLAKPDGTGFVEVLPDVSRVLSHDLADVQHLSVVYQRGTSVRRARFSLVSMKLEEDQEIATLPERI
jgi:hypothetical protein